MHREKRPNSSCVSSNYPIFFSSSLSVCVPNSASNLLFCGSTALTDLWQQLFTLPEKALTCLNVFSDAGFFFGCVCFFSFWLILWGAAAVVCLGCLCNWLSGHISTLLSSFDFQADRTSRKTSTHNSHFHSVNVLAFEWLEREFEREIRQKKRKKKRGYWSWYKFDSKEPCSWLTSHNNEKIVGLNFNLTNT